MGRVGAAKPESDAVSENSNRSALWPADNPAVMAHLNLLQGIINRLALSSASCKTWCVTLVAALLALSGTTRQPAIVTVALVPVVIFGFMDTMYLSRERAYRALYKDVLASIHAGTYTLASTFEASAPLQYRDCFKAILSWAIFPVYLGLIALYVAARCLGGFALIAQAAAG